MAHLTGISFLPLHSPFRALKSGKLRTVDSVQATSTWLVLLDETLCVEARRVSVFFECSLFFLVLDFCLIFNGFAFFVCFGMFLLVSELL